MNKKNVVTSILIVLLVFSFLSVIPFPYNLLIQEAHANGVSIVNHEPSNYTTTSTLEVTCNATPTFGDVLNMIVGTRGAASRTVSSVAQTGVNWSSNGYGKQVGQTGTGTDIEDWLGYVNATGSNLSNLATITFSGTPIYGAVALMTEYTGVLSAGFLDGSNSVSTSGTACYTSNYWTTYSPELWAGGILVAGSYAQSSPTNGFSLENGTALTYVSVSYLDKLVSSTGVDGCNTTISAASSFVGCIVALKGVAPDAVTLNAPSNNGNVQAYLPINFTYTPVFNEAITLATLTIYSGTTVLATVMNTTVTNDVLNGIQYTFSSTGSFLWNVNVSSSVTQTCWASSNYTILVTTTRYFTSNTWTTGVYNASMTETSTCVASSVQPYSGSSPCTVFYGMEIFVMLSSGYTPVLISGSVVAIQSYSYSSYSGEWNCSGSWSTSAIGFNAAVGLEIEVFASTASSTVPTDLLARFLTENMTAFYQLPSSTWAINYTGRATYAAGTENVYYDFGNSTYEGDITGFTLSSTQLTDNTYPSVADFYLNSTWDGQTEQFAFNCTDAVGLVSAIIQDNCSGTATNTTILLAGLWSWANITATLPASNSVVNFTIWVTNINSSLVYSFATRYFNTYAYNSSAGAWNTPYVYLGSALSTIENAITSNYGWSNIDPYLATILQQNTTSLASSIDSYASSDNWLSVLLLAVECNKIWPNNIPTDVQTDIEYALGNFTMIGNSTIGYLPCTTSALYGTGNAFSPENSFALYGYYYANCSWIKSYSGYSTIQTYWGNISQSYTFFDTAVNYSVANIGPSGEAGLPINILSNETGYTSTNRFYDEDANTIECYLIFAETLNVSTAMNAALNWWNYLVSTHWNSVYGYFRYTTPLFECEAPFFLEIISQLKYYYPTLGNWTDVMTDIGTRFLGSQWDSYQWLEGSNQSAYVVVHAVNSPSTVPEFPDFNNETRMENTLGAWEELLGVYLQVNSTYQTDIENMLFGNLTIEPAWELLLTPQADLYNSTDALFEMYSDGVPPIPSSSASAEGEILLFMMGIVPGTTTIAYPLEQLNYEYIDSIDPVSMAFNINQTARQIEIPVIGTGTITFQYGVSPLTLYFPSAGVYLVSFTNSWNMISSVTYQSALPSNLMYFYLPTRALSVNISPTSVTLNVGQPQLFTSSVSDGTSPYMYQWFLNGAAVQNATSSSWTFTPTSAGSYTVYVEVADSVGVQATSNNVTVTVNIARAIPEITFLEGPYYAEWGIEYWIVKFAGQHALRLVSNC